jgi:hypothetical protein
MTNEDLALAYLQGHWERVGAREVFKFLPPKSDEEMRGRKVLAQFLRSPKGAPRSVLLALARLIDPEAVRFEPRQFQVIARGRGVPPNHGRDIGIARYIVEKRASGAQMKAAKSEAAQMYGVSAAQVSRALKKHRGMFERGWFIK